MTNTSVSFLGRLQDRNDADNWMRLHEIYAPLLRRWLASYEIQGPDEDDLVQAVMMTVASEIGEFQHNGRTGAFRSWLKNIMLNRIRAFWQQRKRSPNVDARLSQFADPHSELARQWDAEHDQHVLQELLRLVRPQFQPQTWLAFQRTALEGAPPAKTAQELGITTNAVFIAKSRVMRRLREEADGLVESSSRFSPNP